MKPKKLLDEEARLLKEAREQVGRSYGQKLMLVVIACTGFAALHWLGAQKDAEKKLSAGRWQADKVLGIVDAAVVQATEAAGTVPAVGADKPKPSYCSSLLGSRTEPWSFGSREQLIAAMQERADACVWAQFRLTIKKPSKYLEDFSQDPRLEELSKNPRSESEKFTGFADYIAKEEALANVTARVARQHVAARLAGMPEPEPLTWKADAQQTSGQNMIGWLTDQVQKTAAEDSSLHVFYEMVWYASLLLGVIASAILFMALLHALPLTSGEGYWTKRISDILDRIPARSVMAVPLAAVTIGAGTLAGSIASTEPGGQKRELPKPPSASEPAPPNSPSVPWTYLGADSNTAIFYREGDLAFPPPLVDLRGIKTTLDTINTTSKQLVVETQNARQSTALALWLSSLPPLSGRAKPGADEALRRKVDALALQQEELIKRMDKVEELKQLIQEVHTLADTMEKREATIDGTLQAARGHGDRQEQVSTQTLGQTAEIDPRNVFKRTFYRPLYAVGPLIPNVMDARLKDTVDPEVRDVMVDVLKAMRKPQRKHQPPYSEKEFTTLWQTEISLRPLARDQVELLLRDTPALLKICALPRF